MPQTVDLRSRRAAANSAPSEGVVRVPPHNLQAEESVLGAMLLSREAIGPAVEVCSAPDFYKPAHGHIFDAIVSLWGRGEPADPVTVGDELQRAELLDAIGGMATLITLQANTPATSNVGRYAHIVEEHALLRRMIQVAGEIADMGYAGPEDVTAVIDEAESMMFNIAQRRNADTLESIRELLKQSLDRLEALYDKGESVTGVPTGFVDLDDRLSGLQPSALLIVGARPAMGKCVAWDTPIIDPVTGDVRTAAEVHRRGEDGEPIDVLSLDEDRQLKTAQPSAFVDDGIKPLFRVRTKLGREIRTTLTHPFLTPQGWTPLGSLQRGSRVAVPRELNVFGIDALPESELALLAYMLTESATRGENPQFRSCQPATVDEAARQGWNVGARALRHEDEAGASVVFVGQSGHTNPIAELLRRHGILTCGNSHRELPSAVYRLPRPQMAAFLSRLLSPDTDVVCDLTGASELRWKTTSVRFARNVQHLLLRFGINAQLEEKKKGCSLLVHQAAELRRFSHDIGLYGRADELKTLVTSLSEARNRELVASASGGSSSPIGASSSPTFIAPTLWDTAAETADEPLGLLGELPAHADIRWDHIVSIDYVGDEQVYDLTVPYHHNFVAADFIVHNTSFALNMVSNAALSGTPVLYFSLEMSHMEITQRLLCAEARVDASRLRNGRLHDTDWPKINSAIGRLGEAPIFIDDNPNLTVMDIRAKARRLKASPQGVGLIVIDYLQLMSGRSSAENRQVEVSEMSRGLKILARELNVPVVALSQLSRSLEMRADKRPVLADLRESGSLEQDADVVMFLYRDEVYNPDSPDKGTAEVIVSKHRNGPVGTTLLAFIDRYTRFANIART